jgi:hypothetical protein
VEPTLAVTFDSALRGSLLASILFFGFFPLVFLAVLFGLWRRHHPRRRLGTFLVLLALFGLALIYRDWFGSTYFRIALLPPGDTLRLDLALPERRVTLAMPETSVSERPGPRGRGVEVVLESAQRRYVSPVLFPHEPRYIALVALLDAANVATAP